MTEKLAGIDAAFLYLETDSAHMHVVGTVILGKDERAFDFRDVEKLLAARIHRIPAFTRRMRHVPLRLGHPVWVEDVNFRLATHLRRVAVPKPATMRELAKLVAQIASIPLDRSKPLWELWVVEGVRGGRTALVCKFHHAVIDGVTGADLMQHLFDLTPTVAAVEPDADSDEDVEEDASSLALLATACGEIALQPFRIARSLGHTAVSVARMAAAYLDHDSSVEDPVLPVSSPRTLLNHAISADRCVAFGRSSLADIKEIKNAMGMTVNDVVLAACTQSLRKYLAKHDSEPTEPLVAAIPVSIQSDDDSAESNNALSAMFVRLPVHVGDPLEQLKLIQSTAGEAKALQRSSKFSLLSEWAELLSPTWFAGLINLYSSYDLADSHAPLYNLVISNVPGPPMPLYCAGHPIERCVPLGPIFEGAALNITVMSYVDRVDIGVIGCPLAAPAIEDIVDEFESGIAAMLRAVRARKGRPARRSQRLPAKARRRPKAASRRASQ